MVDWCHEHKATLLDRTLGLFICCINDKEGVIERQLQNAFPAELYDHATVKQCFGGKITMQSLSLPEKGIVKMLGYTKDYDTINYDAITEFANAIVS